MRVVLHNGCTAPQQIEATRVVIEDDFGNPIAAAVQVADNTIMVEKAGDRSDAEFAAFLQQLGVRKTVIVHQIAAGDVKPAATVIDI